ncbi:hypothetical protein [Mesoflavibacter profundi]|uniref:hypothetical protein n=1 Tax=Mesoflavibacter profundi TaxID=2708110 RepID=UPI00168AC184|nr:hypothetical protein [Mesoflavibacter profundi]
MYSQLILDAFEKVKSEEGITVKTNISKFLSDYIQENTNTVYGEKSLRNKHNKAVEGDSINLKLFVANGLSMYLGFDNYHDYYRSHNNGDFKLTSNTINKNSKTLIIGGVLAILIIVGVVFLNSDSNRWMVWENDRYVEVKFDAKKYNLNQLKIYKSDRIENFRQVELNCDSDFFNEDGSVRYWYGKNKNKEINFFSSLGLHPLTGKTLKPITNYIINKYVCPN